MAHAPNYYDAIYRRLAGHIGRRTVEVGAGVGTFAELIWADPEVEKMTLIEPAENNYPRLLRRFANRPGAETLQGYLDDFADGLRADAMVLINVLEHVEYDLAFLESARRVLEPSGRLLILVPAMPAIFGELDRAFEHFRRYSRPQLKRALEGSGFQIRELQYMNLPGAISWFIVGRILRQKTLSPRQVETYDRWVVPWMTRIEKRVPPPFGQSLLAVAEVAR
jgi:SAM-dependent methyltransferase